MLRAADAAGDAVVPVGGGTLLGVGNPPRHYEIALSTLRLDTVHDYDYRDLTIGAGAGMTVAQLASVAREASPIRSARRSARRRAQRSAERSLPVGSGRGAQRTAGHAIS